MRTINDFKLRAWHKKEKCMLYMQDIYSWTTGGYSSSCALVNIHTGWIIDPRKNKFGYHEDVEIENENDLIIMFWTGLYDINSKEIYEGDIVRFIEYPDEKPRVIEWYQPEATFTYSDTPWDWDSLFRTEKENEVIGNIYENKELLKEK